MTERDPVASRIVDKLYGPRDDERAKLDDVDPRLTDALRALGDEFGPLGVALAAARATDTDVLLDRLSSPEADFETNTQIVGALTQAVANEELDVGRASALRHALDELTNRELDNLANGIRTALFEFPHREVTPGRPRRLRTARVEELAKLAYYAYGELAESPTRLRSTHPNWDELSPRRRSAWLRAAGVMLQYFREAEGVGAHENALAVIDRLLERDEAPWNRTE